MTVKPNKELIALKQQLTELKISCEEEEKHINLYEQERERINSIWMIQKRKTDETKSELLNIIREKEDLEETHKIEKKLYQQKIKYVMLKHKDEKVELIKNSEITLKQIEDSNKIKEKDYKYDKRSLSKMLKEQNLLQLDFIHALKKENIKKMHDIKSEYELREAQMRNYYRERIKEINFNMEEKRKKIIQDITDKKLREIKFLTEEHANTFNNMKNYYADLNKKNLARLKNLAKNFWDEVKNQDLLKSKKNKKTEDKRKIEEPLNKLQNEISEFIEKEKICLENHYKLTKLKKDYKNKLKELLDCEFKLEVTLQKNDYLDKKKIDYTQKYKDKLHLIQQKAGLRVSLIIKQQF